MAVRSFAIGALTADFTEYGGYYTHHNASVNVAHLGIVRKLNKNTQVAGFSFRLDKLPLVDKL